MDMLFNGKSASEPGTLFQIKNKFGHRQVTSKVMDCVNHVDDLIQFVTSGLVCLLVMDSCVIKQLTEIPTQLESQESIEGLPFNQHIKENTYIQS